MQLTYAIKYVADMERSIAFHRDVLGLELKFQSPEWSEFATGETALALHLAGNGKSAGTVELGFGTQSVQDFYDRRTDLGIEFTRAPTEMHGMTLGAFRDPDGAETSIGGPA